MKMVEKVNELLKEMEVAEKYLMGLFTPEQLANLDVEDMKVFKSYINLMKLSKDLMLMQATYTDNMNSKLDNINEKLDSLLESKD